MHVFVTGATGWVGSAVVRELLGAGHQVTGLARCQEKGSALAGIGAKVVRGTLDDLDVLHQAASAADAVIHTAFNHDFSRFAENAEQDRRAILALGGALQGSERPLLVTSGLFGLSPGASELEVVSPASPRKSEATARDLAERGVRVATVRLAPSVHGAGDYGFVPILIRLARDKGISAYPGDGSHCWSGVHRLDAARVYRLALEQGVTQSVYHAVADEAVPFKDIAQAIGQGLGMPVGSRDREHFGWFAHIASANMTVSSEYTRGLLGWVPSGPGLLADLEHPDYYAG